MEYVVHCGTEFASDTFAIWIRDRAGNAMRPDASGWVWEATEPGVLIEPSIRVPGRVAPEFARAIAEWHLDRTFDPGTEAKVLREALDVERRRVDRILDR